jgi:hypothetical protein
LDIVEGFQLAIEQFRESLASHHEGKRMNCPIFIYDNGMIVCAAPEKKTGEMTA